tara:strand:+ start:578 stop:958 length:381 start_codon:yes stop_codon:yes gene_type:complete
MLTSPVGHRLVPAPDSSTKDKCGSLRRRGSRPAFGDKIFGRAPVLGLDRRDFGGLPGSAAHHFGSIPVKLSRIRGCQIIGRNGGRCLAALDIIDQPLAHPGRGRALIGQGFEGRTAAKDEAHCHNR